MSAQEEYKKKVLSLLSDVQNYLDEREQREVRHLVDHNEHGEALCSIAWIIVDKKTRVPARIITSIRGLSDGLNVEDEFPPNLDDYAIR